MNREYTSLVILALNIFVFIAVLVALIRRRKRVLPSGLLIGISFILTLISGYARSKEGIAIFSSLFAGMIMATLMRCLKERNEFDIPSIPELIGAVPSIVAIYAVVLTRLRLPYGFLSSIEVPFVVLSGVIMVMSGTLFIKMSRQHRDSVYLGLATVLGGILAILHPVIMSFLRFHYVLVLSDTAMSLLVAFLLIRLAYSRESEFLFFAESEERDAPLEPGAKIVTPKEYQEVKEDLKDYPVLAFVRDLRVPEKWNAFYVSNAVRERAVSPTNLPYIIQVTSDYFREAKEKGIEGVVVIDCLEYLLLYNGFEAVVKFLATLVDLAIVNNGVLYVVVDNETLEKRQFATLRRIFGLEPHDTGGTS